MHACKRMLTAPPVQLFHFDLALLPWKLLISQMILCGLIAIVVYSCIVNKQPSTKTSFSEVSSYIIGFGIVIPVALYVPFIFLTALDIQSKTLSMALICLPILVTLRCLEGKQVCFGEEFFFSTSPFLRYEYLSFNLFSLLVFVLVIPRHTILQQCLVSLRQQLESQ